MGPVNTCSRVYSITIPGPHMQNVSIQTPVTPFHTHTRAQAVLASAAKRDEEDTLQRLRARHDAAAGGLESGWDVFSLRYEVGAGVCVGGCGV